MNFDNKVVVITGASRGIGKTLAYHFAKIGCKLIITYNTSKFLSKSVKEDIECQYGVEVSSIKCDLTNELDIINLVDFVKNKYQKVDILINNAALSLDNDLHNKTKNEFMNVLEVNVVGTFLMIKYMSSIMNSNSFIFNISSTDAIDTFSELNIDYSASKAAINNLTKSLSLVLDSKIISICPNWVDTETIREMNQDYLKNELKRIGQRKLISPITIAQTIEKLMRDNIMSGSIIRIDGDINE